MINTVSEKFIGMCKQQTRESYVQAILGDFQKDVLAKENSTIETTLGISNKNNFIIPFETNNASDSTGSLYNSSASLYPAFSLKFNNNIKISSLILYLESENNTLSINLMLKGNFAGSSEVTNANKGKVLVKYNTEIECDEVSIVYYNSKPNTKGKISNIYLDNLKIFEDNIISDYDIQENTSLDSSEISSRTMTLEIVDKDGTYSPTNPNNLLSDFSNGKMLSLVYYLKTDIAKYEPIVLGIFKVNDCSRNYANKTLSINCYDDLYFLNQDYIGTPFYEQPTEKYSSISDIIKEVFNFFSYTNYTIRVSSDYNLQGGTVRFSGYVPKNTFRETLRMLCENFGLTLKTNRYNQIFITNIKNITIDSLNNVRNIINGIPSKYVFVETPQSNANYINSLTIENPLWRVSTSSIEKEIVYQSLLETGTYLINFSSSPIYQNTLSTNSSSTATFTIVNQSAEQAIINVSASGNVILDGKLVKDYNSTYNNYVNTNLGITYSLDRNFTWNYGEGDLQRIYSNDAIKNFKFSAFKTMAYELECLMLPYIETGDIIQYIDRNKNVVYLTVSQIGFTKSIIQTLRGE